MLNATMRVILPQLIISSLLRELWIIFRAFYAPFDPQNVRLFAIMDGYFSHPLLRTRSTIESVRFGHYRASPRKSAPPRRSGNSSRESGNSSLG